MKVQKIKLNSYDYTWLVLDNNHLPIKPITEFIRYLNNVDKSPCTIRSYAYHLKLFWEFLYGLALRNLRPDAKIPNIIKTVESYSLIEVVGYFKYAHILACSVYTKEESFVIHPSFATDINSMNRQYKVYSSFHSCVPPCIVYSFR